MYLTLWHAQDHVWHTDQLFMPIPWYTRLIIKKRTQCDTLLFPLYSAMVLYSICMIPTSLGKATGASLLQKWNRSTISTKSLIHWASFSSKEDRVRHSIVSPLVCHDTGLYMYGSHYPGQSHWGILTPQPGREGFSRDAALCSAPPWRNADRGWSGSWEGRRP